MLISIQKKSTLILLFVLAASCVYSQQLERDSLRHHTLHTLEVTGKQIQTLSVGIPTQVINSKQLSTINAINVADVAKHFAGVTVKDYGGIGGLKTVSVRGMGAQHTGVSYDGMMMSDVQSGQIDLSQFTIENIANVSLSNGQPNSLLLPARMFGCSSVLSFSTEKIKYDSEKTLAGNISVKAGSFGMYNSLLYLIKNLSQKWNVNVSANGLTANGEYKFMSNLNPLGTNWVEKNRINSDVHSLRTELNSTYQFNSYEYISLKLNQHYSERGLPGTDTYYLSYATERLLDKNYLAQFQYQNRKNCYYQYQFSGKFSNAKMRFTETDPKFQSLINRTRIDNYAQNEYYLTTAFQFYPVEKLTFSTSFDWWYNNLFSDSNFGFRQYAAPTRHTGLANIAAKYSTKQVTLTANMLYTLTRETNQNETAAPDRNKLSPTVSLIYKPFENKELRLRAFYKNIFRLPTFNDLYYHDFGHTDLRPEITNQFNTGITYFNTDISFLSELECSLDAYYNRVTDKISVIYGIPFSSVRNIGRVEIKGCDVNFKISKEFNNKSTIRVNASYSYQLAQDYTLYTETYLDIIPYTPVHSGSGSIAYQTGKWECGYNYLLSGKRFSGQNSNKLNLLKPYVDHSLFARISIKKFSLLAEIINLTNKNYEIVSFYPMPGRNYRFTINYKF